MSRMHNVMRKACAAFFVGVWASGGAQAKPVTIEGARCEFETVVFDATFEGGRLAACRERRKGDYILAIRPESAPINPSPWYAVDIQSSDKQKITVTLDYGDFRHRYSPDIKPEGGDWRRLYSARSTRAMISATVFASSPVATISAGPMSPSMYICRIRSSTS